MPIEDLEPTAAQPDEAFDPNVVGGVVVGFDQQPLSGVTVTLDQGPGIYGPFTPIADGAAILHPHNRTNPVETGDDGRFAWDVLAGWFRVTASKDGCVAPDTNGDPEFHTGSFKQPTRSGYEWVLVLDCRPIDNVDPVLTIISRPDDVINETTAIVEFEISDDQGHVAAFCFSDQDTYDSHGQPELVACSSPYEVGGFTNGDHSIGILVTDAQDNFVFEEISFTVAT